MNDTKKINAFEQGLKYPQAIYWCIISKERWDNLLPAEQNFDIFYNQLSKYISKNKTLLPVSSRSSNIGDFDTQGGGYHELRHRRGHGRGRIRGRGRGRGSGRCRSRGGGHNPYSLHFPYDNGTFIPEAKIYNKGQYQPLSRNQ